MKPRIPAASEEFVTAQFGDERLTRRLARIADCVAVAPGWGLPQLTKSDGELEGVYRFLGNERVTPHRILAPHFASTVQRVGGREILIVHDTTELRFGGVVPRAGLGRINKAGEGQGFLAHFALAVRKDGNRQPLGVAGLKTHVRTGPPSASRRHARKAGTETERSRWFQLALEVGATFPTAIHVMDREADSYEIASELIAGGARFVIRISRDRILAGTQGRETTMFRAAEGAPAFAERTVPLSRRQGSVPKRARKIHPRRKERVAALKIRASTYVLKRPNRRALDGCPPSLPVNMVQVDEVNPPPGEDPVSWKLLTTESIGSAEEVEAIVDAYRARWVIEEYFKALKTGCAFERRQLESFRTLVNALAIFSVIAWRLLLLRSIARSAPSAPAGEVLTDRQVEVLGELSRMRESTAPRVQMPDRGATAADALRAVAQLGGHLKNNGPPGWQVLGRGYESLLLIELGWRARERCDR